MSLGESLSFSEMLEKHFSKIIKLGVRMSMKGRGCHYKMLSNVKHLVKKCKLTSKTMSFFGSCSLDTELDNLVSFVKKHFFC